VLGGCSSVPLSSEPDLEPTHTVQEEVTLNDATASQMRLISRLYVGDHAALEWYQPIAGVIGFSVVQDARYEPIDRESLRGLKPTQVFKRFARSLEAPAALVALERNPEVLQDLQDKDALEVFTPEADLHLLGVAPQADFQTNILVRSFPCGWINFNPQFCSNLWDEGACFRNQTVLVGPITAETVDESQSVVCSFIGTNRLTVNISGCVGSVTNQCDGAWIPGAGGNYDVSPNFYRSWHGIAQTFFGIDDGYKHSATARPKTAGAKFQFQTRVFWDL
jgi:hypothetical protein